MRPISLGFVLTFIAAILAAGFGGWLGASKVSERRHSATVHNLLLQDIKTTPEQDERLKVLEGEYESLRKRREAELRMANAELAAAILKGHAYTPEVQAAVERFHHAMGEFQKETIVHVLEMRAVLNPEQAARLDKRVSEALTTQEP
ncbi:periplasmic heavy metal sensor [Caulobacter segnis]|uniref:Spy/CpxP family protein refolding chaperone n=1 Tax=Caulobacter segnis TaxID=88688 RepID=UPI00240F043E|nr:periplasmic heavy metal sensor [Caulobacter segnis]MDG2520272.1 periplasmic heavy metal sensor [Caulobacter segnis]